MRTSQSNIPGSLTSVVHPARTSGSARRTFQGIERLLLLLRALKDVSVFGEPVTQFLEAEQEREEREEREEKKEKEIEEFLSPAAFSPQTTAPLSSGWISSPGSRSPFPQLSFSPPVNSSGEASRKIARVVQELQESEQTFVASLRLAKSYLVEPMLVRCSGLLLTCAPLIVLNRLVDEMITNHEKFLGSLDGTLDSALLALQQLLSVLCYLEYSGTVSFVLCLIHAQQTPFSATFVTQLRNFLEKFQPGHSHMDYSVNLLLHRPMARIAKYPLLLSAIVKLDTKNTLVTSCLEFVTRKLTEIDRQIETETIRFDTVQQLGKTANYREVCGHIAAFFGPLSYCGTLLATTVKCAGFQRFYIDKAIVHVMCHSHHLVVGEKTKNGLAIRFLVPYTQCTVVSEVQGCMHGLTSSGSFVSKIMFYKHSYEYEILLASAEEDYCKLKEALGLIENATKKLPGYNKCQNTLAPNLEECYVDPSTGIYDIRITGQECRNSNSSHKLEVDTGRCYFRQVNNVDVGEALQQLLVGDGSTRK